MRATNSGAITFGLVSVPVKVYVTAKSESVSFNMLSKDGNPVKQVLLDKVTGEGISRALCIKGFQVEKGKWISFTKEEIQALSPDASKAIEVSKFVKASQVNPMSIEKTHYLGPGPAGEKAYALFSQVMSDKNVCAIAQWTNRGKDHLVAICPHKRDGVQGLIMQQLYYDNEVRSFADIGIAGNLGVTDAEKIMAAHLIDSMTHDFNSSEFKDEFLARVSDAVQKKLAGLKIEAPAPAAQSPLDLLEALKASLEAQKKTKKAS